MKKTLLIALLLIPFLGIAQEKKPIEGFLGIKFGTSKEDLITAIKAKGGSLTQQGADPNFITFANVNLGDRHPAYFFAYFVDNKVYKAGFSFKTELEEGTIGFYNSLVNDLNGVYGQGKSTKVFKDPYTEGDSYEVQGISLLKVFFETKWINGDNNIDVFINNKLSIILSYNDGKLTELADKQKKEKQKSDL